MQQFKDNLDQSFEAFETSFSNTTKPTLKKSISTGNLNCNKRDYKGDTNYIRDFKDKSSNALTRHSMCNMSCSNQK